MGELYALGMFKRLARIEARLDNLEGLIMSDISNEARLATDESELAAVTASVLAEVQSLKDANTAAGSPLDFTSLESSITSLQGAVPTPAPVVPAPDVPTA